MPDDPSNTTWFWESVIKMDKVRHPSNFPSLSAPMLISLGQIAAVWSLYEQHFEDVLERLVFLNQTDDPDWRTRLRGKKRRKRMRAEATAQFKGHPAIVEYIRAVMSDADTFSTIRNTLLA